MIFCFKNLIFSEYNWTVANRSWQWNNLSNVIHFQNKVWYFRCSALKNSTFFWIFLQLAWITAIFCFKKHDNFLHIFWKNQNFGLLARSICVTPELFDIGGSTSIIWSLPSSNGLVIGSLLASGGRKNHFFVSTVEGWNNHLHILKMSFYRIGLIFYSR